jgi:CelD/BcsL family acetyltransferase involved in cellulose biosynthesis
MPLASLQQVARTPLREAARRRRQLSRNHRLCFLAEGATALELRALLSWKNIQFPGSYERAPIQAFFESALTQVPGVRLFRLLLDNTLIAAQLAIQRDGTCVGLITGFDPAWHSFSPGKILMTSMFEQLQQEGIAYFDAGRGAERYKEEYGHGWYLLYRYERAVTLRGHAYLAAAHAVHWARDHYNSSPHRAA